MKKIYINPTTQVLKVELSKMVATSIPFGSGTLDPTNAESREDMDFWEDEDDFSSFFEQTITIGEE